MENSDLTKKFYNKMMQTQTCGVFCIQSWARDNMTMFTGQKIVVYYIMYMFEVAVPLTNRDFNPFVPAVWPVYVHVSFF